MMNLPPELHVSEHLPARYETTDKKNVKKPQKMKFDKKLIQENLNFLEYIAYGASENQLAEVIYEIEPEQLAAVRNLAKNLMEANKEFIKQFVINDMRETYGKRPFKMAMVPTKNGTMKKKVQIKHPVTPNEPMKLTSSTKNRIGTLERFMQTLLSETAKRPALRAKARLLKAVIKGGLELFKKFITPPITRERGEKIDDGNKAKREPNRKKGEPKEKEGKRSAKRLRDDDEKTQGEKEGWLSDSDTIPDPDAFKKHSRATRRDGEWFHNNFSQQADLPPKKKARKEQGEKPRATFKGAQKASREAEEVSSNYDSSSEEEEEEDGSEASSDISSSEGEE